MDYPSTSTPCTTFSFSMSEKSIQRGSDKQSRLSKRWKKTEKIQEMDSDEELTWELEKAVESCKMNKPAAENMSSTEMPNCVNQKMCSSSVTNEPLERETNLNVERKSNADALMDITELVNYFFLPKKSQNCERIDTSYSLYEKQGAIPKNKLKTPSNESNKITVKELMKRIKSRRNSESDSNKTNVSVSDSVSNGEMLNPHCNGEIVKVSEDICLKPFFYVVPENPSPNFFLPRGSYYVTPEPPSPSAEERENKCIVFHPERGAPSKAKMEFRETSEIQSNRVAMNNLGKDVLKNLDSHLNIGPQDVKRDEFFYNLETDGSAGKVYQKNVAWFRNTEDESEERCIGLEISEEGFEGDKAQNASADENYMRTLHDITVRLQSEFPDFSTTWTANLAQKYAFQESELENFIASERLERKMQAQFERLVQVFPEMCSFELFRKCKEFEGDERRLDAYIKKVQLNNKFRQQAVDMQFIFPDADPDFLFQEVKKLGGDENALTQFTEQLLESKNYPKILEDHLDAERKRLWNMYAVNFNVENYLQEVPRPERFAGPSGNNNKADENLILKYLRSRYPSADFDFLEIFRNHNRNLTKTCDYLNLLKAATPLGNSLKKEPFDEEFLKEICYIEHKREIDDYLDDVRVMKEVEKEDARLNDCFLYCPLCCDDELVASEVIPCPEGHVFCTECLKRYIFSRISDGVYKFICPVEKCDCFFTLAALESILPKKTVLKVAKKQQAEEINSAGVEGLESCPYCEFAYIPNPGDNIFKCQNLDCLKETCRKCGLENHIPLRCEEIERPADVEARKRIEETMTLELVRTCPSCGKKIVRQDGCNKMSCPCGTLFCYVCRRKVDGYNHFNGFGCPLYSTNAQLHGRNVVAAGVRTLNEIIRENPDVRILYDPTKS